MKEVNANLRGKYVITSPNGCTVTQNAGKTTIFTEVPANVQTLVVAQTGELKISDDDAVVTEVFNLAPAPAGQGEGGGMPAGYKRVEWLESTGTQWIGTNVPVNSLSTLQVTFEITQWGCVVGATGQRNTQIFADYDYFKIRIEEYSQSWEYSYGKKYSSTLNIPKATGSLDGEVKQISDTALNISPRSMSVFSRANGVYPMAGKIYIVKTYEEDKPVSYLVPALDPTGAPCMFDMVSRSSYYNSGTGDFLYPGKEEEPATFSRRRPITYAQLTEHGVRRLYKVPAGYNGTKEEYAAEHGFKPLVETPQPEEGYWTPRWTETEDEIVLEWVETEPPAEDYLTQPTE